MFQVFLFSRMTGKDRKPLFVESKSSSSCRTLECVDAVLVDELRQRTGRRSDSVTRHERIDIVGSLIQFFNANQPSQTTRGKKLYLPPSNQRPPLPPNLHLRRPQRNSIKRQQTPRQHHIPAQIRRFPAHALLEIQTPLLSLRIPDLRVIPV